MSLTDILGIITDGITTGFVIVAALMGFWFATGRHLWRTSFGSEGWGAKLNARLTKIEQNQEDAIVERETDRTISQKAFLEMRVEQEAINRRLDGFSVDHQLLRDRTVRLEAIEEVRREVALLVAQKGVQGEETA